VRCIGAGKGVGHARTRIVAAAAKTSFEMGRMADARPAGVLDHRSGEAPGTRSEEEHMSAENEELVRRFFEEFCNERRDEVADEIVSEDYAAHGPQAPPANGVQELKDRVAVYQDALDGHWDLQQMYSAGDVVVARWVGSGTHRGELMGIAPTEAKIEVDAISIFRVAGGKIAEEWTVWDALGLLQQVGAVPAPA
jgi:predicted ester cyclase